MPDEMQLEQQMTADALALGASGAGAAGVAAIPFRREFRAACEQNTCGAYGTSYTCPPACGGIDEMIAEAQKRRRAFVFQTIGQLDDSFDIEGMQAAQVRHQQLVVDMAARWLARLPNALGLSAGACRLCEKCGMADDIPCRHPESAFPSMEAYGIAVSELAPIAGLKYINGANTVTYFGAILYGGAG